MLELNGVFGRPYIDLEGAVDTGDFEAIDDEIALGLCLTDPGFCGAGLRSLGWATSSHPEPAYVDAEEVIAGFGPDELDRFIALADDPDAFLAARRVGHRPGDASEHCFGRRQMLYLKHRHGVHFPWSVAYPMLAPEGGPPGAGRDFSDEARRLFPHTVRFVRRLPFVTITRCVVYGLDPDHRGPTHRDCAGDEPGLREHIIFVPGRPKHYFLWSERARRKLPVESRVFWFNDRDYHGVEPAPWFRYSIEVDGALDPDFVRRITAAA